MDKISAQELRIGNWVRNIDGSFQVTKILEHFVTYRDNKDYPQECRYEDLRPIVLTPELLERCGFDGNPNTMKGASLEIKDHERVFKSISIYYNNDTAENQYYLFMREGAKDEPRTNDGVVLLMRNLQYLHQLQNLYYALTTIELDVKK